MHGSPSFRFDHTVEAVTRAKRVVQSVSNNLTTLLHKIGFEDNTFRVIVQEALKMKRDHPDQFLFESFDEYIYDAFMKLLLTTSDELFKQVLKKDRNIPTGRSTPCESPVFKMINRVTDHTYRQRMPRKSSEDMLVKRSRKKSKSGNTTPEPTTSADDQVAIDLLERENELLRLEVARCQRSIKRFTLPAGMAADFIVPTSLDPEHPNPAGSRFAETGSHSGADRSKAISPTAVGRTLHSLSSSSRKPRNSRSESPLRKAASSPAAGIEQPDPEVELSFWFDYFMVFETTPPVASDVNGRSTKDVLFRFPPDDRTDFELDVNWRHFLSVPHEVVTGSKKKRRVKISQALVYSAVLSGDRFLSCVTLPSAAVPGKHPLFGKAQTESPPPEANTDEPVPPHDVDSQQEDVKPTQDSEQKEKTDSGSSSDDDTIEFVDEELEAVNVQEPSSGASSPGGLTEGSVSPKPQLSPKEVLKEEKERNKAKAKAMTTFVLVSRVPWFQLHENVIYRIFNMLRDCARSGEMTPIDFLKQCAAEASSPLPLVKPVPPPVVESGGGSKSDDDTSSSPPEEQLLDSATSVDRFRWRLRQLFELRRFHSPCPGLLRNFPALHWTTPNEVRLASQVANDALSSVSGRVTPQKAKPTKHVHPFAGSSQVDQPMTVDPWCFELLHQFLSPSTIATVLKSLLLCESVLLLSESLPLLAPIAEALRALMGPFPCTQVYIPYLPRDQFQIVKSPFPFFVGSLVQDFQFVPDGVTFLTVMIDSDRAIPPLQGEDSVTVDFPYSIKLQLVSRITAEYRKYASVQTDNTEEQDEADLLLAESVHESDDDFAFDPLDTPDNCSSPSSVSYNPSAKQQKQETEYMYKVLKRRMRSVKKQRDSCQEGTSDKHRLSAELKDLTLQYKAYHSAKLLNEATQSAGANLIDDKKIAVATTPLLQRLRRSDKQQLQPHLVGSSSNEFAVNFLQGSSSAQPGQQYLQPSRQKGDLLLFAAGLRATCAEVNKSILNFFSFHDMLYNIESEALQSHHHEIEFLVRHPQGISVEGRRHNLMNLRTVEFFQKLVVSQNYQMFKEDRLQCDERAHELTTKFRRQSRHLLNTIIDEKADFVSRP